MGLKSKNTVEKNLVELEVEIEKDVFAEAVTAAFRKNAGSITVPGFRKGKAPRNIVEKMYGKNVFYDDALQSLIPGEAEASIKEAELEVVSQPDIDLKSADENGVLFTVKVYVKPEVTVKDYKGVKAVKKVRDVSDSDIMKEIDNARQRNARKISVDDRPAGDGDTVLIDYMGFVGDTAFEGGTAAGYELKLGSGTFIPGFEDQIVGHNPGDKFDVIVTFPEQYQSADLAGKEARFECTLHEITTEELPEADDEFAKDVSEFDTFAEYKDDIGSKIKKRYDTASDRALEESLIDGVLPGFEADIPEVMYENELNRRLNDLERNLNYRGIDVNTYMQITGQTVESLRAGYRAECERIVKTRLALEAIGKAEGLTVSESDIESEFGEMAENYGLKTEDIKKNVDEKAVAEDLLIRKALEFVRENAVITEEPYVEPVHEHDHGHGHDHEHDHDHEHAEDCDHN